LPLATLGPWLSGCTALTKLVAYGSTVSSDDELLYLPAGLQELGLGGVSSLQQLPCGLKRMSALRALDLDFSSSLCQLPIWLSCLQQLETLGLGYTGVVSEQAVLVQMPMLKCVALPRWADPATVFGEATHLQALSGLWCVVYV
jgi:hypothetical protein